MPDNKLAKVDENKALTNQNEVGLDVAGLEGMPASDLPLPIYKFTGPSTKDKVLADGSECPNYVFLNTATKEYVEWVEFRVLVMAKGKMENFNDPTILDDVYSMVARDETTKELFLMSLRSTSLYDFRGRILGRMVKVAKETGGIFNLIVTAKAKERTATLKNGKNVNYKYVGFDIYTSQKTDKALSKELAKLQADWKDYLINRKLEPSDTISEAEAKGKAANEDIDQGEFELDDLPA